MFDNIGDKIKRLAKIICWIGIIASIISAISLFVQSSKMYSQGAYVISGIIMAVLGCVLSWAGSFVLYGFGELITTQQEINSKLTAKKVKD